MVDRQLVDLMGLSLDAALRPEAWENLLDGIVDYLGIISCVVAVADPAHQERKSPFQSRFIRCEAQEMYKRFLAREDVDDTPAVLGLQRLPLHHFAHELEMFGVAHESELPPSGFRDFQRESFGIRWRFGMHLNSFISCSDVMFLHTADDISVTRAQVCRDLELLAPFLGKSLRLSRIFDALRARFNAMLGALDRLRLGAVLLLEDGTIIQANETAKVLLSQRDGLRVTAANRLEASDQQMNLHLKQAIYETHRTAVLDGWTAERAFAVSRPSGRPAYLVSLGPIVDALGELEKGLGCAIAFITDPAETTPISTDGLRAVGQLTAAEAAVCHHLVNGLTLEEIAARRGVARETVRSQVKAVMAKLRCTSRLELVRLAALTRLPIDRPDA